MTIILVVVNIILIISIVFLELLSFSSPSLVPLLLRSFAPSRPSRQSASCTQAGCTKREKVARELRHRKSNTETMEDSMREENPLHRQATPTPTDELGRVTRRRRPFFSPLEIKIARTHALTRAWKAHSHTGVLRHGDTRRGALAGTRPCWCAPDGQSNEKTDKPCRVQKCRCTAVQRCTTLHSALSGGRVGYRKSAGSAKNSKAARRQKRRPEPRHAAPRAQRHAEA
jgi:hypothetical protein